ncbi:MAG TPA: hypothetical protein VKY57_00305 [Chitinispirillaceae bacterium]|nr:hypothetical protein [Chitinispirillaceae bacterium]
MFKKVMAVVIIVSVWIPVKACIDPLAEFYAGVVFNDNEQISFGILDSLAENGNSVIRECAPPTSSGSRITVLSGLPDTIICDPFQFNSVNVIGSTIEIIVQYGGGCKKHKFSLLTTGLLKESFPPQLDLILSHDSDGDECKAIVTDTLLFDLSSLFSIAEDYEEIILNVIDYNTQTHFEPSPSWFPTKKLCAYKVRSAYSPNVMAYIGHFQISYQPDNNHIRLAVMFDTSETVTDKQKAEAVEKELQRLKKMQIVSISEQEIILIKSALEKEAAQYWTSHDTVLAYNTWLNGNGVKDAVRVNGVWGGCEIGIAYELPDDEVPQIEITDIKSSHLNKKSSFNKKFKLALTNGGVIINLQSKSSGNEKVNIYDLQSRLLARIPVKSGLSEVFWDGISTHGHTIHNGCFIITVTDNKNRIKSRGRFVIPY